MSGAVDEDAPGGGFLESRQHAQQRRFTAARATQQAEDLALIDAQGDIVHRDKVTKFLGDIVDADIGLRPWDLPRFFFLCRRGCGLRHDYLPVMNFVHMRVICRVVSSVSARSGTSFVLTSDGG